VGVDTDLGVITRASGGAVYRMTLQTPVPLRELYFLGQGGRVEVYKIALIGESGYTLPLSLDGFGRANNSSDMLVKYVDLQLEAFGANISALVGIYNRGPAPVVVSVENMGRVVPAKPKPESSPDSAPATETKQNTTNRGLRNGDVVFTLSVTPMRGVVIASGGGGYALRLGSGQISNGWTRGELAVSTGCGRDLCVGDLTFTKSVQPMRGTVIGITVNSQYILRLGSGQISGPWGIDELAAAAPKGGCATGFCVGDRAYTLSVQPMTATIIGADSGGGYMLRLASGQISGPWQAGELAKAKGCGRSLCVGNRVITNSVTPMRATVIGIAPGNSYMLRLASGQISGPWQADELRK
jgi:hypothetical protein